MRGSGTWELGQDIAGISSRGGIVDLLQFGGVNVEGRGGCHGHGGKERARGTASLRTFNFAILLRTYQLRYSLSFLWQMAGSIHNL